MKSQDRKTNAESKEPTRMYEFILQNIKEMIDQHVILPGERLPSERELAERFNVSRVPVREAIKILEYTGMIESRQGDGMYLRESAVADNLSMPIDFQVQLTSDVMIDLFEMRMLLESKACYYAAQRRTKQDILTLKAAIASVEPFLASHYEGDHSDSPEEPFDEPRKISHQFHTAIIDAAHNTVLSNIYRSLFELLGVSKQLTINTIAHTYNNVLVHRYILDRIIARDSAGAEQAMFQHLTDAKELFLKTLY